MASIFRFHSRSTVRDTSGAPSKFCKAGYLKHFANTMGTHPCLISMVIALFLVLSLSLSRQDSLLTFSSNSLIRATTIQMWCGRVCPILLAKASRGV